MLHPNDAKHNALHITVLMLLPFKNWGSTFHKPDLITNGNTALDGTNGLMVFAQKPSILGNALLLHLIYANGEALLSSQLALLLLMQLALVAIPPILDAGAGPDVVANTTFTFVSFPFTAQCNIIKI